MSIKQFNSQSLSRDENWAGLPASQGRRRGRKKRDSATGEAGVRSGEELEQESYKVQLISWIYSGGSQISQDSEE